ncbi:MAG: hypothetical protein Q7T96_18375 [Methylobacter sp.]|nr:hypothetical protein [Methylobacter sp.]
MPAIRTRLKALQQKLNPVIGLPILILDYLSDEIEVCDIVMYRMADESRQAFCSRVQAYYDEQVGIGLTITIYPAERYADDE